MDQLTSIIEIYNKYASDYDAKFRDFDLYHDTFTALLSKLKSDSTLLELGCGPGNVIQYCLQQKPSLKITGIDLAENMLEIARANCPDARYYCMNILEVDQLSPTYDAVVAAFCLPYIAPESLDKFFNNLNLKTNPQGLIYLSCMEGESDRSGFEKTSFTGDSDLYIYYHQRNVLEEKLVENGFVIEHFYTKDYPESDGSFTTDLIYIGQKA